MKKRIFSIVLSLCMVLMLCPVTAFATNADSTELQNLLNAGDPVTLKKDYTIDTMLEVNKTVTLDLNGHVIKMTGDYGVIRINKYVSLTLEDSDSTATHTGGNASLPAGGVITGGKAGQYVGSDGHGGGVLNTGTFTMNGGTITGCSAKSNGGGVYNTGSFTMNGGTITGCSAESYGGGVHNTGSFTMNGGAITDCSAKSNGGGVYNETIKATTMRANGGEIKGLFNNAAGLTISKENDASGTTFTGDVTNYLSTIDAGIYMGTVTNDKGIYDTKGGTISGGIFKGTVINTEGGTISGGMFYGGIENNGIISGNKVTFMKDGSRYALEVVAGENQVVSPVEPTQDGYTFTGWYTDKKLTNKYEFGNTLSENIILYAGFEPITYTVEVPFTTTVKQGGNVAPGKTTFNLQVVDRQGNKQVINDVEVTASITTNGVGDHKGTMTLTGPSQRFYDMFDNGGIFVQQVNAGEANWTYDDTVWCLLPSAVAMSSTDDAAPGNTISIYPTGFEESDDGGRFYYPDWDKNPVSKMTFTNTYTKSVAEPSGNEGTTNGDSKTDADTNPKTGDDSNLTLWLTLLALSAAGAGGTCMYSRRRRRSRAK